MSRWLGRGAWLEAVECPYGAAPVSDGDAPVQVVLPAVITRAGAGQWVRGEVPRYCCRSLVATVDIGLPCVSSISSLMYTAVARAGACERARQCCQRAGSIYPTAVLDRGDGCIG